jgi:2-dehydro-3-deoxyphosphooctonate aldolase (KDO 8-P synthase)
MTSVVRLGPVELGEGRPLVLILGPCQLEDLDHSLRLAAGIDAVCREHGQPWVFKASFDKANRSSLASARGPGLELGLRWLEAVRDELGVPVTTDVHSPEQVPAVARVVDLLQVPAFLCRQTDLLVACAASGRPVNVKKGQFMAPWDMAGVLGKLEGAAGVMLTERGTSFGYNRLVTDMTGLVAMRALGAPVCMDATHAVQQPGGLGGRSGGDRRLAPALARAAVAVGVDAVFAEVHEDPDRAPSDGPNMLRLEQLSELVGQLRRIEAALG